MATAPHWPDSRGERVVFLLDASSGLERRLLESWIAEERPASAGVETVSLPPSRRRGRGATQSNGSLETCLASGDDVLLAPLRVAWEREQIPGERENPIRELLTLGDPRDPGRLVQEWLIRRHPERCHVVAGEPAHLSELRDRWSQQGGSDPTLTTGLADFVERQATLALERAERRMRGQRYKVPRLVREDILARPTFKAGLARLVRQTEHREQDVRRVAKRYLGEIAAAHNPFVIELTAHLIHMLYRQGYEDLRYDRQRLHEIYARAQRHPVVFLPSHKSNLDHLVLQYALHENGLPPNHTAGGINMNFFPVGPLVRRSGVFFIRRSFKDNPIYKFVLRQYVDYLIEKRFSLEWYIEGGRSRSGKLLPPRLGLLAYVVDAYRRGKSEDVVLVPVSIAYDQIEDVSSYAAEQRGAAKQKESFGWFVRMVRSLRRRFGRIHINFGEPLSLREAAGPPVRDAEPNPDEDSVDLQKIAFEAAVRINRVTPLTPTSLLTLALLGAGDRALSLGETRAALGPLLADVRRRELPTTDDLDLDTDEGLSRTLASLIENGVVQCFDEGPEAVYAIGPDQHLTAAYYRNTIIHFFVNDAIAELALLRAAEGVPRTGAGGDEAGEASAAGDVTEVFWDEVMRLRDLLKFEFFFAEKEEYREEIAHEMTLRGEGWQRALTEGPQATIATLWRWSSLLAPPILRPFLEAYRAVADTLETLGSDEAPDESELLNRASALAKQYVLQRRIHSRESVSRVLFQTALGLARNRRLLEDDPDVATRRTAFAEEVRDVIRRIDAVDGMAASRRAGLGG